MRRIILAAVFGFATSPVGAAVLFSDDFNGETLGLNAPTLTNWDIQDGAIDIIGAQIDGQNFANYFPGNGLFIDLDGSTGDSARLSSFNEFLLVSGTTYSLSFDYGRNQEVNTEEFLTFGVAGFSHEIRIPESQTTLETFVFSFVAGDGNGNDSFGNIFFETSSNDQFGPVLDNIVLSRSVAAVPLPATAPLLLTVLAGIGVLRRRRA